MGPLPHGMAPPLSIFPWWLKWIALAVLAALLWWLWHAYLRDRVRWLIDRWKAVYRTKGPPARAAAVPIEEEIEGIRKRYGKSHEYREGLFDLGGRMKTFFEGKTGLPIEEMTATEIGRSLEGDEPAGFFARLEEVACAVREPDRQDFTDLCGRALGALKAPLKTRRRP